MKPSTSRITVFIACVSLCGLLLWTGCDSTENDEPGVSVTGRFAFSTFAFDPSASALPTANVLNTLVVTETALRFFANGQFTLEYRFQDTADDLLINGTYDVRGMRVNLDVDDDFEEAREELLLPDRFTLQATTNAAQLQGNIDRDDVNLAEFSSEYSGLDRVSGTLRMQLNKQ